MKKDSVKVKETITFADEVRAINDVVDYCFIEDEGLPDTGYLKYCPYFYDAGLVVAIVMYFMDGVEFEENEDMYMAIMSDSEIVGLVDSIMSTESVQYVRDNAEKLLEFRKQEVLNNNAAIFTVLLRRNENNTVDKTVQDILNSELERTQAETDAYKAAENLSVAQTRQEEYTNQFINQFTPEEYADITRRADEADYDMDKIADIVAEKFFESDAFKDSVIDLDEYKEQQEKAKEEKPKKTTGRKKTTTNKTTKDADKNKKVSDDKKE